MSLFLSSSLPSFPTMQESIPPLAQQRQHHRTFSQRLKQAGQTVVHHAKTHAGVGTVCAVAYFDPYVVLNDVASGGG